MIDRKLLREDSDYRTRIEAKRVSPELIDEFLSVDEKRTGLITTVEDLRSQKNAISKEIGQSTPEDRESKLADAAKLKDELEGLETQLTELEAQHRELILQIPNPIHESVPLGGEDDYEIIKTVGEQYSTPKMDHADYGEYMGWVLSEQGATVSGSRFAYLAGDAVRLEFALVQWTMSVLTEKGFTPVVPPVLVRESTMEEAGFFPTDENQVYHLEEDNLYLVGTSEVPLSGIHRGQTLLPTNSRKNTLASHHVSVEKQERMEKIRAEFFVCINSIKSKCSSTQIPKVRGMNSKRFWPSKKRSSRRLDLVIE